MLSSRVDQAPRERGVRRAAAHAARALRTQRIATMARACSPGVRMTPPRRRAHPAANDAPRRQSVVQRMSTMPVRVTPTFIPTISFIFVRTVFFSAQHNLSMRSFARCRRHAAAFCYRRTRPTRHYPPLRCEARVIAARRPPPPPLSSPLYCAICHPGAREAATFLTMPGVHAVYFQRQISLFGTFYSFSRDTDAAMLKLIGAAIFREEDFSHAVAAFSSSPFSPSRRH